MEIKEIKSFEFNGNLYFTKQEAIKAQALYQLKELIMNSSQTDLYEMSLDNDNLNFLWQIGNLASKIIGYDTTKMIIDSLELQILETLKNDNTKELISRGYIAALSDVEQKFNKLLFENN